VLGKVVSTDVILRNVFTANSRLAKVVSVKFAAQPLLCAVLCETAKKAVKLSVHQDGGRPRTGIPEILETEAIVAEISVSCQNQRTPRCSFCNTTGT
jgi:radical SAM superfamily enzyme with C-terminal helix-hairpin-helix motif